MSNRFDTNETSQFLDLSESIMTANDLDKLADNLLSQVARLGCSDSVFLYITSPQLFTTRFYERNVQPEAVSQLKQICAQQLDRLMSLPPAATTPSSWKSNSDFTVYPLRDKFEYVGMLGMILEEGGIPIGRAFWDRFLCILANTANRLAKRRKTERQLSYLNTYMTVSSMLAQSLGLHDMLETALYCCMEVVSAEAATVFLLDDEGENFLFYQVEGPVKPILMSSTFPAGKGIAGAVLTSGQAEVINDAQNDPRLYNKIDAESGFQTRNMIALPLIAGEEQVGVLEVLNKFGEKAFTEEELLSLMMISEEVAFAIRNAKMFEYVVDSYCKQRQGLNTCKGCERPLGSWTPCVKYRESII
ncbi:MAG: GAF domain-containing protein [Chloroflexi bacterium]|nr:GAF domain-containing protein [Chloroflexota bacterium]MBU1660358.1 GAF domain-containing protein [Chloroflexota bacterium]